MLPTQVNYPEFVPDQLLTSEHLNQLFGYLEEQDRLTRTNLIGIGIVCGLEVKTAPAGDSLNISKGVGITSQGYLVSVPGNTYTAFKEYDAVKERLYDRFVDGSKNQRFKLYELMHDAVEEGTTSLNKEFLNDKVVLIFVEILEEGAKNCNPNSCDDKGILVTVSFKPLLISKTDAEILAQNTSGSNVYPDLPEMKMPRFDVLATNLLDTADIFTAYQKVLNENFLGKAEQLFTQAYTTFSPLIIDLYPVNPFNGFAARFSFLHDDSINLEQLLNLQYYYDLLSDLLLAYQELKDTGNRLIAICCPDSNPFPRHLLLGLAIPDSATGSSTFRHYFIPSPILQCQDASAAKLRSLFVKMALMLEKFFTPPFFNPNAFNRVAAFDDSIRITPSKHGDIPFSEKSIPFYYKVIDGSPRLLEYWNFERSFKNTADKNLSYYARDYNGVDDEVINPLLYDLEPFNFLRIEGHLGKPYTQALRNIIALKNKFRLPFEVVALSADVNALKNQIRDIINRTSAAGLKELFAGTTQPLCQFQDLESMYDAAAAEFICTLCKEMKYFYNLPGGRQLPAPESTVPQADLLKRCDPNFRFVPNSFGHEFELFYAQIKNREYIPADVFLRGFFEESVTNERQNTNIGLALLYYIEKLSEAVSNDLSSFDTAIFNTRYEDLVKIAERIKALIRTASAGQNTVFSEDVIDHLDVLIYTCKQAEFASLIRDYLYRWLYILLLQRFAYFTKMHPGIQHKAGVTIGGTFILVYHEQVPDENEPNRFNTGLNTNANAFERFERTTRASRAGAAAESESIREKAEEATREYFIRDFSGSKIISERQRLVVENLLNPKLSSDEILDKLIAGIADGIVIADFYLPYLCYSDCPPVHYILAEKEPAPEDRLSIKIAETQYCSDDRKAYLIEVSPAGGEVSGEGVKTTTSSSVFLPAQVDLLQAGQKAVKLTYSKDAKSAEVEVTVFQKPEALFEVQNTGRDRQFQNLSAFATKSEWDFGDGSGSSEESPSHTFPDQGSFTVALKVSNGICSSTASQVIVIEEQQVSINLEVVDFCSNDESSYAIAVSPPGGQVGGEGVQLNNAGEPVFIPGLIAFDGLQKQITLTYILGGATASIDLSIFRQPLAAFTFQASTNFTDIIFSNTSQSASGFQWDFGDNAVSEEENPLHRYQAEGSFVVVLKALNGICSSTLSQTVEIRRPVVKTCLPLPNLLEQFQKLESIDPQMFEEFTRSISAYGDAFKIFDKLTPMVFEPVEAQVEFLVEMSIRDLIARWLEELMGLAENSDFKVLAMALYRITVNLSTYISCIQPEDVNTARIPLEREYNTIATQLSDLPRFLPNFPPEEREQLKQLRAELQAESERIQANAEDKPVYRRFIEEIIRIIDSLGL